MPSYRQSGGNTAEHISSSIEGGLEDSYPLVHSSSQQTYDDSMPYDADDGLGDYEEEEELAPSSYYHQQGGGGLSALVVPHTSMPSTIDEETKEEILSDEDESGEIKDWLSGINRPRSEGTGSASGSGEGIIAKNKMAGGADGDADGSKSKQTHKSLVRWLSESSEMCIRDSG